MQQNNLLAIAFRDESIFLFSHLFFFPAILFFLTYFASNFAHISPSSPRFMTALLEYFVNGICSIGVLVIGDCSIRVS